MKTDDHLQRLEASLADLQRHSELQDREALALAHQLQRAEREIQQLRERLETLEDAQTPGRTANADEKPPHW